MKKLLILILLPFSLTSYGQGLLFEKAEFEKGNVLELDRAYTPSSYSLERYAPLPYAQSGGTCVAHAFTNARTILLAKQLQITNAKAKLALLFSPFHFYYKAKSTGDNNCKQGLNLMAAAKHAMNLGYCPMYYVENDTYYPFSNIKLCDNSNYTFSSSKNNSIAGKYKLQDIYTVSNLKQIRYAISQGMPVVVGMAIPTSFENCTTKSWAPKYYESPKVSYKHAMLCIGYDDNYLGGAFRIMNSWGTRWGDNGFIWVRYSDLAKWTYGGVALKNKYVLTRGTKQNENDSKTIEESELETDLKNNLKTALSEKNSELTQEGDKIIEVVTEEGRPPRKTNIDIFKRVFD